MIKAGIVGGTGYVAGELIRLLVHHPEVEIDFVYSHSLPGKTAASVHRDLLPYPGIEFQGDINPEVDVLFLCLGHGKSREFLAAHTFSDSTRVIDLGSDFRLDSSSEFEGRKFNYGLTEVWRDEITAAQSIANPGCFATAIQLGVVPLAAAGQIRDDIHVHAITGSTGAGRELKDTSHFSWRNNNISVYKPFGHQHLGEIRQTLGQVHEGFDNAVNFLPVRGNFTRGIFASIYTACDLNASDLHDIYSEYYSGSAFVHIADSTVDLKQVVNTNHCFIEVQKIDGKVLITSVIDNLVKGASGQAIQNMNLIFGFDEQNGLRLKPSYF